MNINEYIEKHSTVSVDKKTGLVTVIMEVPYRRQITYKHEECEESKKVKIKTGDVQRYLTDSGLDILSVQKTDSINNTKNVTACWEYNIATDINKKKKRKTNTDKAVMKKDNLKEVLEDIN